MLQTNIIPPFWRRVLHVLRTDLARERGWLLGWLLLLTARALDHWDAAATPRLGHMLDSGIALSGLALGLKLVFADAPGSSLTASLTRPLGRSALWTAKLGFMLLALWLPYLLMHALAWRDFGLDLAAWMAVLAITGLPSLTAVFLTAWLAALGLPKTGLAALVLGILLILALPILQQIAPPVSQDLDSHFSQLMPDPDTPEGSLLRCRMLLLHLAALSAFGLGWLLTSLNRRSLPGVTITLLIGLATAFCWTWDWQNSPTPSYTDTHPALLTTSEPAPGGQALWPGLHLIGLPDRQVAAVVALAPVVPGAETWPPETCYSDFTTLEKSGKPSLRNRWMCVDHAQRLSALFPAHLIWVGQVDRARPNLRSLVNQAQKRHSEAAKLPWRLRLLIHEWKPVSAGNLQTLGATHLRLTLTDASVLSLKDRMLSTNQLRFDTHLVQRSPRLRFSGMPEPAQIHRLPPPPMNVLMTARAPVLDEVIVAHGESAWSEARPEFWIAHRNSHMSFQLPLPVIHMDMTGLNLADWMKMAETTIWLPQERGILDFEISAEDLARALH